MITAAELARIMPHALASNIAKFVAPLNAAMEEFEIDNAQRQAAFIAQIAHESGSFRYVRELATGEAYEGRKDLGNTEPGDGRRFRGRGLIQITGRSNYVACGNALGIDFVADPKQLEEPINACRSAAWFWKSRGLNDLADRGDFKLITKRINGGYNGLKDRVAYYERAQEVLGG